MNAQRVLKVSLFAFFFAVLPRAAKTKIFQILAHRSEALLPSFLSNISFLVQSCTKFLCNKHIVTHSTHTSCSRMSDDDHSQRSRPIRQKNIPFRFRVVQNGGAGSQNASAALSRLNSNTKSRHAHSLPPGQVAAPVEIESNAGSQVAVQRAKPAEVCKEAEAKVRI